MEHKIAAYRHKVVACIRKPVGYWTLEKRQVLWDMYVGGKPFGDIAKHFGVTIAAAQRQVYNYKKG